MGGKQKNELVIIPITSGVEVSFTCVIIWPAECINSREITAVTESSVWLSIDPVAYRGGRRLGGSNLPEIPKALQNRAKLNPIVKTVKICWI